MSERGSFVTEFIYCPECFEACKRAFFAQGMECAVEVPCGEHNTYPIIAGKAAGMGPGDEFINFETEILPKIQAGMCPDCKVRVVILADNGASFIYTISKESWREMGGS